jgi:hypothetical protein
MLIAAAFRLVRRAGWAPVSVLILHAIVAETPFRQALDFAMHLLAPEAGGGTAFSFRKSVAAGAVIRGTWMMGL